MTPLESNMTLKTACVIGAGSSGLTAVHHLRLQGFQVTCLEARSHCGGTWVQDERDPGDCIIELDELGTPIAYSPIEGKNLSRVPPTAIYDGLRTNLHKHLMENRYHAFPQDTIEFPPSGTVFNYIETQSKGLEQFIRYNRFVTRIYLQNGKGSPWIVESVKSLKSTEDKINPQEVDKEKYDYVVLANGHYAEPKIPSIKGFSKFDGIQIHARWYRNPIKFTGMNCIVVGKGPSGVDIVRELAIQALNTGSGTVYNSNRQQAPLLEDPPTWYNFVQRVPEIVAFERDVHGKNRVVLKDGSELCNIDVIIWATGYYYSFPFADPDDYPFNEWPLIASPDLGTAKMRPARVRGQRVHNLDSFQIFYFPEPSLSILGLPYFVVPFPLVDVQARTIARVWKGDTSFVPEKSQDEIGEDRTYHLYPAPKEYDVQDALVRAIGEGGRSADGSREIDDDGKYFDVAEWRRNLRKENPYLRKKILGY